MIFQCSNVQKSLLEEHRKCKKNLTFNEMRLALVVVMCHSTQWGQAFSKIAFEFINRIVFQNFSLRQKQAQKIFREIVFFSENKPHCVPLFFTLSRKLSYLAWSKIDFHFMPGEQGGHQTLPPYPPSYNSSLRSNRLIPKSTICPISSKV